MARRKHKASAKTEVERQFEQVALQHHIQRLGLATTEAYQAWCVTQGLSPKLHKTERQREHEISHMQNLAIRSYQGTMRRLRRDPLSILIQICDGQRSGHDLPAEERWRGFRPFSTGVADWVKL